MEPILEVVNLSIERKSAGKITENISFRLFPGKTLALIGESGSGKSLTALGLARLLPESLHIATGEVLLARPEGIKINLAQVPAKEMNKYRGKEIGFLFQDPFSALNPVLTCGRQLVEALTAHRSLNRKSARAEALSLLLEVGLLSTTDYFNAYPHELSGGEKQRIVAAMAIAAKPSILIADEPTTALDESAGKGIILLLKKLQEKYNLSVLLISHDLSLVEDFADTITIIKEGKLVEQGTTAEILINPAQAYTKGLLNCKPLPGKRYRRLPVLSDFIKEAEEHIPFNPNRNENIISQSERNHSHREIYARSPVLSVRNLCFSHRRRNTSILNFSTQFPVLRDISFDIFPGETFGIAGDSGSGKTTLGKCIVGLIEPKSGNVRLGNHILNNLSGKELRLLRKDFQVVFQHPFASLNPRRNIGDSLTEPLKTLVLADERKHPEMQAKSILQKVGLDESYLTRYPEELSGGELQRICIARALIAKPKLVVFDEPLSSVDVSLQAQIINLINQLKQQMNFTCVFISHDMNILNYMSDRIAVIKDGMLTEIKRIE